jgi:glycosyltransferase involved in cell wall biosynthesis
VIYVDDGSRDGSLQILRDTQAGDARVRIVELAGNYGQHAALFAGIEHARGQYIVMLDVDLQCDPRDIPRMLAPLAEGYDLVCGVRVPRRDPLARQLLSRLVTAMSARLTGVQLRDAGCPLNAVTAELARKVAACGELRRFAKPHAVRMARRVAQIEVRHAPRPPDKPRSSYSSTRLVGLFMDFLVNALGDVLGWVFLVSIALALALALATLAALVAGAISGRLSAVPLVTGALCALAGLTALLALVGEYMQRIYRQTAGAPMYIVRRVHEGPRQP